MVDKDSPKPLSVTPQLILSEFDRRKVLYWVVGSSGTHALISYKDAAGNSRLIRNVVTDSTAAVSTRVADNKYDTYLLLNKLGVRTPETIVYSDNISALEFLNTHKKVVVKPLDSSHGNGVTVGITDSISLDRAVSSALEFSKFILIQKQVSTMADVRLVFIDRQFVAATQRIPASVTGDGSHTIDQLIEIENNSGQRIKGYGAKPSLISVDQAKRYLGGRLGKIPISGQSVQVVGTANIGTGGIAIECKSRVPKVCVDWGKQIVDELSMDVCGVDFIIDNEGQEYMIEINASPSFGLHHFPHHGSPVDVTSVFVDMIMRPKRN